MTRRAGRDPANGPPPSSDDIERIGRAVLAGLPEPFCSHVRGVVIRVQDFPDDQTLAEMGIEDPFDLLGLFEGFTPPTGDLPLRQPSVGPAERGPDLGALWGVSGDAVEKQSVRERHERIARAQLDLPQSHRG